VKTVVPRNRKSPLLAKSARNGAPDIFAGNWQQRAGKKKELERLEQELAVLRDKTVSKLKELGCG